MKNGRVGTIVGLDPAGPGFTSKDSENRLSRDDADYVECLHTNGRSLGLMEPICSTDFYPNFGLKQPGCNFLWMDPCSHSRSWKLFAESLSGSFNASECESMQNIHQQSPCNGTEVLMGGDSFEAKRDVSGIFFLRTNGDSPFSIKN